MRFFSGILMGFFLVGLVIAAYLAVGGYNVAATVPPSKMETRVATWALNRSIARRASADHNPQSTTPATWKAGMAHFKENCVVCHGATGVDAGEIGQGLNPPAPDLTLPRVQARPDGELYWIVANGIKSTGMPAFSPTHKPDEIWKIVAFIRHLPELTNDEQTILKASGEEAERHHDEEGPKATAPPAR